MRVFVLGICGTFMGGVARLASELGYRVGGCDASMYPPMSTQLEAEGIETFLKNQFGFGGTGELPFVETVPQLFVLHKNDIEKAKKLIEEANETLTVSETWTCPKCGTEIEGRFTDCWNCAESNDL